MRVFYLRSDVGNLGDNLNKIILEWLGYDVEYVGRNTRPKLVATGSVATAIRDGDVVWGTGCIRNQVIKMPNATYLAVRGKLTRDLLREGGAEVPEVYGDPALLLPLIYNPDIKEDIRVGYVPHYIDKKLFDTNQLNDDELFIDIQQDMKSFVDMIKRCSTIHSSSLHGLVIAEAYGKKAVWVKYSDEIIGGEFKFRDYLTGTGREPQSFGPLPSIKNLKEIQRGLLKSIIDYYGERI